MAAPSPIDEDFLLFLADSIEQDGEWIDPLSMIDEDTHSQESDTQSHNNQSYNSQTNHKQTNDKQNKQTQKEAHDE